MGRAPCCEKVGLKRGRWTSEEDEILTNFIQANGEGSWRSLPKNAGLLRCGKSCRLRWINYLRSDLKRGSITGEEEKVIINLHSSLGNRWSQIAAYLPGRTDNEIKNYWNSHLSKKIESFITRPVNEIQPRVDTDLVPTKRRRGRTSPSAIKKNKSYCISKSGPKLMKQLPKEANLVNSVGPLPPTPIFDEETIANIHNMEQNVERESLGSAREDRENRSLMLCPSEEDKENEVWGLIMNEGFDMGWLCSNDMMGQGGLDLEKGENNGMVNREERVCGTMGTTKMATIEDMESHSSSSLTNNSYFVEEEKVDWNFWDWGVWDWLLESTGDCGEGDFNGREELDGGKQSDMVAWLLS